MAEKFVLICINCQYEISKPISIDPKVRKYFDYEDMEWECAAPEGTALTIEAEIWVPKGALEGYHQNATVQWLNLEDVLPFVSIDYDLSPGCCGPSGAPNRLCQCGELVGAENSDCSSPHWFRPLPEKTEWVGYIPHQRTRDRMREERIARRIESNRS